LTDNYVPRSQSADHKELVLTLKCYYKFILKGYKFSTFFELSHIHRERGCSLMNCFLNFMIKEFVLESKDQVLEGTDQQEVTLIKKTLQFEKCFLKYKHAAFKTTETVEELWQQLMSKEF